MYRFETSILLTSGSAIIGSLISSRLIITSLEYFALSSGANAGLVPFWISLILLSAILIRFSNILLSLSMPLSIITLILFLAIFNDSIRVLSLEIQIEAFAFISAVQSVKVNAWSANKVPR